MSIDPTRKRGAASLDVLIDDDRAPVPKPKLQRTQSFSSIGIAPQPRALFTAPLIAPIIDPNERLQRVRALIKSKDWEAVKKEGREGQKGCSDSRVHAELAMLIAHACVLQGFKPEGFKVIEAELQKELPNDLKAKLYLELTECLDKKERSLEIKQYADIGLACQSPDPLLNNRLKTIKTTALFHLKENIEARKLFHEVLQFLKDPEIICYLYSLLATACQDEKNWKEAIYVAGKGLKYAEQQKSFKQYQIKFNQILTIASLQENDVATALVAMKATLNKKELNPAYIHLLNAAKRFREAIDFAFPKIYTQGLEGIQDPKFFEVISIATRGFANELEASAKASPSRKAVESPSLPAVVLSEEEDLSAQQAISRCIEAGRLKQFPTVYKIAKKALATLEIADPLIRATLTLAVAKSCNELGKHEEAEGFAINGLKDSSSSSHLSFLLNTALMASFVRRNILDQAEQVAKRTLQLDLSPHNRVQMTYHLASILLEEGKADEALEKCKTGLAFLWKLSPDQEAFYRTRLYKVQVEIYIKQADAFIEKGNYEAAQSILEKALELPGENTNRLDLYFKVLFHLKKYSKILHYSLTMTSEHFQPKIGGELQGIVADALKKCADVFQERSKKLKK